MSSHPSGTVTFLFTDIEGSTRRWERYPDAMRVALARHDAILRAAIAAHQGYVFKTIGDAFCAAFQKAEEAVAAGLELQRALQEERWTEVGGLTVRVALHTGEAEERDGDYFGPPVNRVARLLSAGHGNQVLLSNTTMHIVRDRLAVGASLQDLGEHQLKDLQRPEHIFQLNSPGTPSDFPALVTLSSRPNNLPLQPTPFIGREEEVSRVQKVLQEQDTRLLTLTGPGGIGKTRLSLQVAANLLDSFTNGVFFAPLGLVDEPHLVAPAVAQVLGLKEAEGQDLVEDLKEYLRRKKILLILDNFEQVLQAAKLVATLLSVAPGLKMLITSRVPLRIYGEVEFAMSSLSIPDPKRLPTLAALAQNEAVQLFVTRARAAKSDFSLTEDNAAVVVEICRRLDGLPLAIELAAARAKLLSPQAILSRLKHSLKLLTGGSSDLPARQQTLRGAIDWSYKSLTNEDGILFRRVAVFAGGFSLEAVEAVCNTGEPVELDMLEGMESLVSKSLIRQVEQPSGELRFSMLETIREYALERLVESGEEDSIYDLYVAYYLGLVEEAEKLRSGPQQISSFERLEVEHDNLRAVLRWLVEHKEHVRGLRLGGALARFWLSYGHLTEGRNRLNELLALDLPRAELPSGLWVSHFDKAEVAGYATVAGDLDTIDVEPSDMLPDHLRAHLMARASALNGAGNLSHRQGDFLSARGLYEQSLTIRRYLRDQQGIAACMNNLANVAYRQGDYDSAHALYKQSLAIKRELGDKRGIAATLNNMGIVTHYAGDYAAAHALYEESLALRRDLHDQQGIAVSLHGLGNVYFERGEYKVARNFFEESLSIRKKLGDIQGVSYVLHDLGNLALEQGNVVDARILYRESLNLRRQLVDKVGIATSFEGFARLACAVSQPERGLRLVGAADALRVALGAHIPAGEAVRRDECVNSARTMLGAAAQPAWLMGQTMTLEAAIAYALEE